MATPKQFTESESAALDPFAVDFFGGAASAADDNFDELQPRRLRRFKSLNKSDWHKSLPQISNAEAEFSNLLGGLPENLTEESARIIAETIAKYTFQPTEHVKCKVISISENNLNQVIDSQNGAPHVYLNVSCQPENVPATVVLNLDFAKDLIDLILGGKGAATNNLRELSPIEVTIIEFLSVNILRAINDFTGEQVFCLQGISRVAESGFESYERGAQIVLGIEAKAFKGNIGLLASKKFLNQLDRLQNPLIVKKSGRKHLREFEKLAEKLSLRLQVGTTFLDADSLMFLESDDIVLIEKPQIDLSDGNFSESATLTVGSGTNFRLRGTIETGDEYNFRISEITSEETRRRFTPAKFRMDELENEQPAEETNLEVLETAEEEDLEEQISPSLENVQVALRVEIAADKISLRELQNLRAGQLIALGISPNDPVRLITDNSEEPVATGELVEIEGQLGVRLTKVFI